MRTWSPQVNGHAASAAKLFDHTMDTGPHGQGTIKYLNAMRCSR
jgi:hypothetical protein